MHVLGDSTLLMDWENGRCQISNLVLGSMSRQILKVKNQFK